MFPPEEPHYVTYIPEVHNGRLVLRKEEEQPEPGETKSTEKTKRPPVITFSELFPFVLYYNKFKEILPKLRPPNPFFITLFVGGLVMNYSNILNFFTDSPGGYATIIVFKCLLACTLCGMLYDKYKTSTDFGNKQTVQCRIWTATDDFQNHVEELPPLYSGALLLLAFAFFAAPSAACILIYSSYWAGLVILIPLLYWPDFVDKVYKEKEDIEIIWFGGNDDIVESGGGERKKVNDYGLLEKLAKSRKRRSAAKNAPNNCVQLLALAPGYWNIPGQWRAFH
ncbi:unnamed protein product [Caenorhabditis sp. 36 PRJEB53466]|nr:unnamed protein product [Caenorhabditis sp. 36 PRJEB53466]